MKRNSTTVQPTVGLVQARMGSGRLPGKMMMDLAGRPVLEWVLRRVYQSKCLDQVLLATTTLPDDDTLVSLAEGLDVMVFRGSDSDVLHRFRAAAGKNEAMTVVRICADNPLVDPGEIDRVVKEYIEHQPDYAFNHVPKLNNGYPDGLGAEVFSRKLLEILDDTVIESFHRQHVTSYIWEHTDRFVIHATPWPSAFSSHPSFDVKLDIDTEHDLLKMREVCRQLTVHANVSDILACYHAVVQNQSNRQSVTH